MRRRATKQKSAIGEAIRRAGRPLSAQEVCASAKCEVPTINLATVYRQLREMLEQRELVTVELPGMPPRFEMANLAHHHHFFCNSCDKVYDVEGCGADIKCMVPAGFKLQDHAILLYGTCRECL